MRKLLTYGLPAAGALGLSLYYGAFASLFSANYLPHRYCYLAKPGLVWTNVTMDGLIGASYAVIFGSLFWVASQLRSLAALRSYLWIFIAFGTFIVACGATHVMEMITIWVPVYNLSAAVKVVCAAASVPTAILFARVSPALAANIRRFLEMLSTTQREKEQALLALVASEKLAVAGRISASIAHEIKNPLDSVGNLLYVVAQDDRSPADLVNLLEMARSELDRANQIAHDTLGLFQASDTASEFSLGRLVQSVLDLQTAHLVKRKITLQPRLRTAVAVHAYPNELRQILINLIQNAAAAIGSDGRILIRVQPRRLLAGATATTGKAGHFGRFGQPGYSITVADTGSGIDAHHRARLFTLFFTTKGEEGNGLGLWLVRSMVEKHGGRIIFRSRTASESRSPGTLFNVWIPLSPSPVAAAQSFLPAAIHTGRHPGASQGRAVSA